MRTIKKFAQWMATCFASIAFAEAQQIEVTAGGDIVSSYIWRGQQSGGVSIQPAASFSLAGFSLSAWGSVGFDRSDTKEYDFTVGYHTGRFSIAVTDYWFDTAATATAAGRYFDYDAHTTAHWFEITLGHDFGPLAIAWNTCFAGNDYFKVDNRKRAYSTYLEACAPFRLGGLRLNADLGLTPWEGIYADQFHIVTIGLSAEKQLRFTDLLSIPTFTKITFNPCGQKCYFVFGIRI
jgi:hypothetical protein